ncbi:transposase [Paraburkholderia dilworthii]|uniref:transposase n=1 Tax=Paraburkholderia dilworthii TaxID=948106 RepID=UPI0004034875|nr:transposase [Paraburkholderia dilworthii]
MFFDELSNDEWALLAALVSDEPAVRLNRRGRPRADPRVVANAVLWILTTGEPWSKLPGRYPSGPTCRRRFEEWQLNGTLLEMVRLLSRTGRTFAYVPQPAVPAAAKPAGKPALPVTETPGARDENLRGVSWKSPESWQAPGTNGNASNMQHAAGASHTRNWRSADPIADITRQLAGIDNAAPSETSTQAASQVITRAPALPTPSVVYAPRPALRVDLHAMDEASAVGTAMQGLNSAIASARTMPAAAVQRSPLSTSLAPRGRQVAERHGYLIYVAAERVPNAMYRAWAEIMKEGRRVERSGLVGPRFADAQAAEHYAFEWAAQWIDRECLTLAAAEAAPQARTPQPHATPMQTHKAAYAPNASVTHAPYATAPARPLPGTRHLPEPVAAHHGASLHGPLNTFRGPLRRYPGEPAVAVTAAGATTMVSAVNAANAASSAAASTAAHAATERDKAERFPSYTELISHAG